MRDLIQALREQINADWLMAKTEALWRTELGQRTQDQLRAAKLAAAIMREAGLENVERIPFPADGCSTYQDRTMPLAWDASCGRLTVKQSPLTFANPVVADYQRHPFHLINGSVSTPPEGVLTRLITEEQLFGGERAAGAMVISSPDHRPGGDFLRAVLDFGALGIVTDCINDRYLTPDAIPWINACTEGAHWHAHDDDRPYIGFTVSPRHGDQLRNAARQGDVLVHVLSDARRFAGKVETVTGIIPGRRKMELWLYGHLYEPLADDNSNGVISAIALAGAIRKLVANGALPRPEFTLRVIFTLEMYGLSAYLEHRGGNVARQVAGAMDFDGIPINAARPCSVWLSPPGSPFCGDYLLEKLVETCPADAAVPLVVQQEGFYGDDMFACDATSGLRMVYPLGPGNLWHNSAQDMSRIDPNVFRQHTAFKGAWVARMLTMTRADWTKAVPQAGLRARRHMEQEVQRGMVATDTRTESVLNPDKVRQALGFREEREIRRLRDFCRLGVDRRAVDAELRKLRRRRQELEKDLPVPLKNDRGKKATADSWRNKFAAAMVPSRVMRGIPYDLRRVPKGERRPLPDGSIYGPMSRIVADLDGRKNLQEVLAEVEWEAGVQFSPGQVKKYIGAIEYLTDYGYLKTRHAWKITRRAIVAALRKVGLTAGDLAMVHGGLSHFGHIEGGAATVIAAFREVLGEAGTLLMPTFSQSFIYINDCCIKGRSSRPYDPARRDNVWVGQIPQELLRQSGVRRSAHPTHSVAGLGPLAEACLGDHRPEDSPTGRRSPFGKLLESDGKMVWFGAGLAATTFFHFLEDEMDMPYLAEAVCRIRQPDGGVRTILVPKHLPGHRDFYRNPGEETKMYRRLLADGLVIRKTRLGLGEIKVISARQMHELGMPALRDDPRLMLCDKPDCLFCSRF